MKYNLLLIISIFSFLLCSCNNLEYYKIPTYSDNKNINAVIEIPAGTSKKYELNIQTNTFEIDQKNGVDRVINFLPYVGNYGFIPSTYSNPKEGGDGDAIDVLVISESLKTGSIVEITPIAMLKLIDDGEIDYKVIAIPSNNKNQIITATSYKALKQDYPNIIKIIELWFLNYNKSDSALIEGWGTKANALKEISKSAK